MTKYARIVDNVVAEVIDFNPEGFFHPDIVWEVVPDDVEVNFVKSGNSFVAPEPEEVIEPPVPEQPADAETPIGHNVTEADLAEPTAE